MTPIPLRWIKNDVASSERILNTEGGREHRPTPSGWYVFNTPLDTDFPVTHEAFAPFLTDALDKMAVIESSGCVPEMIRIKNGEVFVC